MRSLNVSESFTILGCAAVGGWGASYIQNSRRASSWPPMATRSNINSQRQIAAVHTCMFSWIPRIHQHLRHHTTGFKGSSLKLSPLNHCNIRRGRINNNVLCPILPPIMGILLRILSNTATLMHSPGRPGAGGGGGILRNVGLKISSTE